MTSLYLRPITSGRSVIWRKSSEVQFGQGLKFDPEYADEQSYICSLGIIESYLSWFMTVLAELVLW